MTAPDHRAQAQEHLQVAIRLLSTSPIAAHQHALIAAHVLTTCLPPADRMPPFYAMPITPYPFTKE